MNLSALLARTGKFYKATLTYLDLESSSEISDKVELCPMEVQAYAMRAFK